MTSILSVKDAAIGTLADDSGSWEKWRLQIAIRHHKLFKKIITKYLDDLDSLFSPPRATAVTLRAQANRIISSAQSSTPDHSKKASMCGVFLVAERDLLVNKLGEVIARQVAFQLQTHFVRLHGMLENQLLYICDFLALGPVDTYFYDKRGHVKGRYHEAVLERIFQQSPILHLFDDRMRSALHKMRFLRNKIVHAEADHFTKFSITGFQAELKHILMVMSAVMRIIRQILPNDQEPKPTDTVMTQTTLTHSFIAQHNTTQIMLENNEIDQAPPPASVLSVLKAFPQQCFDAFRRRI